MALRIPLPADFAEHAHKKNGEIRAIYGICLTVLYRWRAEAGLPARRHSGGRKPREIPADLAELAPRMVMKQLTRHYGLHRNVLKAMLERIGVKAKTFNPIRYETPADFADRAKVMTAHALSKHYGVDSKVVRRWCDEAGVQPQRKPAAKPKAPKQAREPKPKPAQRPRRVVSGGMSLATMQVAIPPAHDGSLAARAAEYLRRRDAVFRCDEAGKPDHKGALWFTCSRTWTADELIARAEAKGWDPHAWERIAA